jgi:hypothetical protein
MNPSFCASILLVVSILKIGCRLSLASYGLRDLVCMKIILLSFLPVMLPCRSCMSLVIIVNLDDIFLCMTRLPR